MSTGTIIHGYEEHDLSRPKNDGIEGGGMVITGDGEGIKMNESED